MSWAQTTIEGNPYLVKLVIESFVNIKFFLSDLESLWKEDCSVREALARAREQNKRIEFDRETILSTLVHPPPSAIFRRSEQGDELECKYRISERPFHFKWILRKCDQKEYMEVITKPLLLSASSLAKQNEDLLNIIKQKDLEIEQYKLEGATLKRYKLITEKFNEDEFRQKIRFKPVAEFIKFSDHKFSDYLQMCETKEQNQATPEKTVSNITKNSPRGKKISRIRTHISKVQQHLDMSAVKVNFDDSDSSTPSALSDTEMKQLKFSREVKTEVDLPTVPTASSSRTDLKSNKRLKLSRKNLDL
ncbi:unnamed protein product [Hermetia illucens]|uniref:Non-homologous end-joining factor 1 n=2 Tax=Hermetia illucens TaxID=343691 RepID=A0A7R8V1K5_HERIL|nr:unnamed protein product [Hermetia illucens]